MSKKEVHSLVNNSVVFFIGVLILAFNFNLFIAPNSFVTGGVTGLSVVLNKAFNINSVVFIYIANALLLVLSFIILGKEKTYKSIIGSFLYPILLSLIKPLADLILPYVYIDNTLMNTLIAGGLLGIGAGLVYKTGFSTGGSDIIVQLINKYLKMPEGKAVLLNDIIIILLGGVVYGFQNVVYSLTIIFISSYLIDKILIGISDSKMFFIRSDKEDKIKKYVLEYMQTGATVIATKGAFSENEGHMLMVVVPTKEYYVFKTSVLEIDPNAFFIVSDCYEAIGGKKNKNLPFI